jgi:hypothetical protein
MAVHKIVRLSNPDIGRLQKVSAKDLAKVNSVIRSKVKDEARNQFPTIFLSEGFENMFGRNKEAIAG